MSTAFADLIEDARRALGISTAGLAEHAWLSHEALADLLACPEVSDADRVAVITVGLALALRPADLREVHPHAATPEFVEEYRLALRRREAFGTWAALQDD